jgi:hypothetical protein
LIRVGLSSIKDNLRRAFVGELLRLLKEDFGNCLQSVVIFGSVARNEAEADSDTDVLVVSSAFEKGMTNRMERLVKVLGQLESQKPQINMEEEGMNTWVQFHPLTKDEAATNRAIYLDMTEDAVIVFDKDNFMKTILEKLREKLRLIGAKRILLEDGSWYWDLKPDIKRGEVVEL